MPNPNTDLLNSPRSRDTQFDYDYQERRLHAVMDELYKMQGALIDISAGVTPKRITVAGQEVAYRSALSSLLTAVTTSIGHIKTIDALS